MAADGGPDMMPDLSHLTEEERLIIESVMNRHKLEEERETELMRRKQDEVRILEDSIRVRSEAQRKKGMDCDVTCQICLKTKFADGVGHICNYCNVRCCARCGGKVNLRSNKVIWVCILCRKKQELLIKTGTWMNTGIPDHPDFDLLENDPNITSGDMEHFLDTEMMDNGSSEVFGGGFSGRGEGGREPGSGRREKHYHRDYRLPKDEIRDYSSLGNNHNRDLESFPRDLADKYRDRYNQYLNRLERTYPQQVSEEYCDNRASDSRHYTERRKKTVRFNSEGWDTLEEDLELSGVDPNRWTSASSVYYDHELPRGAPPPGGVPISTNNPGGPPGLAPGPPNPPTGGVCRELPGVPAALPGGPGSGRRVPPTPWAPPTSLPCQPLGRKELWEAERQESQDSQTKDSGIDSGTSSNFNSSEDSSKGEVPRVYRHPVSWAPSGDGTRLVGHMILNKYCKGEVGPASSAAILGLKVTGGKILDSGRIGATIEKVKKGSIADTVGHLRPGDEVIEWNGRSLQGKTFEEVYDIIAESRQEPQVELMVSRQLSDVGRHPVRRHTHAGGPLAREGGYDPRKLSEPGADRRPSVTITSPGSPETYSQRRPHSPTASPKIQVKLCFEVASQQLLVTIMCASNLPPRPSGHPRNPYAKVFLLPDKSEKSKRRTKTIGSSLEPRWNQTFVYGPLRRAELKSRQVEITVWDYDRYGANDFIGEVVVDLNSATLDDEPSWYLLATNDEAIPSHMRRGMFVDTESASTIASTDHLSPPSTTSRLSESDMSDFDPEESLLRRTDGASISSVGSSSRPGYGVQQSRMPSRSATATPTGSPKKRQLPQIPAALQHASRDKVTQELEERARVMKARMRMQSYRGDSRMQSGYSDSELGVRQYEHHRYSRGRGGLVSPERDIDRDYGDSAGSDIESVVSATSAFSTQSERPRTTRKLSRRHLSSLKSQTQAHRSDLTYDQTLPDYFDPQVDLANSRHLSHSLVGTERVLHSPPNHSSNTIQSYSIGVNPNVSRSAPHLAASRSCPYPRSQLLRSNTVTNASAQHHPRGRLQKSHSLGEDDSSWQTAEQSYSFMDDADYRLRDNRLRSRSLTHDDINYRPKKTVTYEDEVLSRKMHERSLKSRSSHSLDKSVPYESDLEVRESEPYMHHQDEGPAGQHSMDYFGNGHNSGSYYGYESEHSGADTEVYLSDRSFDRSFSLEHDQERLGHRVDPVTGAYIGPTDFFPQPYRQGSDPQLHLSSIRTDMLPDFPMEENSTLPRTRKGNRPKRKTLVRANTDGDLLSKYDNKIPHPASDFVYLARSVKLRESSVTSADDPIIHTTQVGEGARRKIRVPDTKQNYGGGAYEDDFVPGEPHSEPVHYQREPPVEYEYKGVRRKDIPYRDRSQHNTMSCEPRDNFGVPDEHINVNSSYYVNPTENVKYYNAKDHRKLRKSQIPQSMQDLRTSQKQYNLQDPQSLQDLRIQQDPRMQPDPRQLHDTRSLQDIRSRPEPRIIQGALSTQDPRIIQDSRSVHDPRYLQDPRMVQDTRAMQNPRLIHDSRLIQDPRSLQDTVYIDDPRHVQNPRNIQDQIIIQNSRNAHENISMPDSRIVQDPRVLQNPNSMLDSRNIDDPRVMQDPRIMPTQRLMEDSRGIEGRLFNRSMDDPRIIQDPRVIPDPRNQIDPRNPNYSVEVGCYDRDVYNSRTRMTDDRSFDRMQDRLVPASHPHPPLHPLPHPHTSLTHAHSIPSLPHPHQSYGQTQYNVVEPGPYIQQDPDQKNGCDYATFDPDTRTLTHRVRHSSSVSINEHPEYFEFDANSPPSTDPRADHADVDPSSNPASEFSQRMTAYGPGGVGYGTGSKQGQLGRSQSSSEVPETEKAVLEEQGEDQGNPLQSLAERRQGDTKVPEPEGTPSTSECRTTEADGMTAMADVTVAKVPLAEVSVAKVKGSEVTVAEISVAEVPVAELPVAEVPVAELPVAEVPVAEVPVAEVPVAEVTIAEVTVAEVTVAQVIVEQKEAITSVIESKSGESEGAIPKIVSTELSNSSMSTAELNTDAVEAMKAENVYIPSPVSAPTNTCGTVEAIESENVDIPSAELAPTDTCDTVEASKSEDVDISNTGSEAKDACGTAAGCGTPATGEPPSDQVPSDQAPDETLEQIVSDEYLLIPNFAEDDGSLSDSAAGTTTSEPERIIRVTRLSKKSSSTSKLSESGRKRKLGFRKKSKSTITVHRSEEIVPNTSRHLMRQSSSQSSEDFDDSSDAEIEYRAPPTVRLSTEGQLSEFIDGLGPGQLVGRQVLAAPSLGDIQLSMAERKSKLEVEVIRARGLQAKTGSRMLPAVLKAFGLLEAPEGEDPEVSPYVKVYLVDGKKCVAKAKTSTARRTLDPLYQQQLIFHEAYAGCILQVTVWGDYGRLEGKKVFMGLAQIMLDDLDLSNIVIGWYKLFGTTSLVSLPALQQRGSMQSLDSVG